MSAINRLGRSASMEMLVIPREEQGPISKDQETTTFVHPMFQSLALGWDRELKALGAMPSMRQGKWEFSARRKSITSEAALGDAIDEYYAHSPTAKKVALLINNQPFSESAVDIENMQRLCEGLGYHVVSKSCNIEEGTRNFFKCLPEGQIHSCIVYLSTHAKRAKFFSKDGSSVNQMDFFKSITDYSVFTGIPKLFIIQACREGGSFSFFSFRNSEKLAVIRERECEAQIHFLNGIPYAENTCILYSITPGHYSWSKGKECGSWFIQTICETFAKYAPEPSADLTNLIALTYKKLSKIFQNQPCLTLMNNKMLRMSKAFHFHYGPKKNKKFYCNLPGKKS